MKNIFLLVLVLLTLMISACQTQQGEENSQPLSGHANVKISGFAFNPQALSITKGTTVTWTNEDTFAHTVTSSTFQSSGILNNGGSYSVTFDTSGIYDYNCSIHPSMKGKIVVE